MDKKFTYVLEAKYQGKGELGQLNRDLAAIGKIESMRKLGSEVRELTTRFNEAKQKLVDQAREMKSADTVTKEMTASYKAAQRETERLASSLERKKQAFRGIVAAAKESGVNTKNLAVEEKRLQSTVQSTGKILSARQTLGVRSTKEINAEIVRLRGAYETLKRSGTASARDIANAQVALKNRIAEVRGETRTLDGTIKRIGVTALGVLSVRQAALYGSELIRIAEQYAGIDARMKMVTGSTGDLVQAQKDLYQISQETGTLYTDNAGLYARLGLYLKDAGVDSKELVSITELVNKSLRVNGSTTEMASSFTLQFGQALGSGVMKGDEFGAMMESNSYFAGQLAKALDTDIAGLRNMASAGELTTDKIRKALPKMADDINRRFKELPKQVDMAVNQVSNAFGNVVNETNNATGGTSEVAEAISELAKTIERNGPAIREFFADTIDLSSSALDAAARLINTMEAFKDMQFGRIQVGDYFGLDKNQQRQYGEIRTELQMIKGLQDDINQARSTLRLHERFSIFYDAEDLAAEKAEISEMESYVQILRERINDETRGFGEEFAGVGQAGKQAFENIDRAAAKSSAEQKQVFTAVTDDIAEKYKAMAERVKGLMAELSGEQQSLTSELREMAREGMGEFAAWKDLKAEADEYYLAAKKAADAGELDKAKELAQEAKNKYKELDGAVVENERVLVSQREAEKVAMAGVREAGELKMQLIERQIEAEKTAATELNNMTGGELEKQFPALAEQLGTLGTKAGDLALQARMMDLAWKNAWDEMVKNGKAAIQDLDGRMIELTRDRHMKVYITNVEEKSTGGTIGAQRMAGGGTVLRNFLRGGFFPGFGGGDRRHVIAEDGEYMLDKYRVADLGIGTVRALHAGRYHVVVAELMKRMRMNTMQAAFSRIPTVKPAVSGPQYMQNGGEVTGGGTPTYNLTINFTGRASSPGPQDGRALAETVLRELKRMHRRSS